MPSDTDTELQRGDDAEKALESQADELEERVAELGDSIDDAKKGLRARKEDADDGDDDDDGGADPLAFDDPEADEDDEDEDDDA
jgi:predicted  nucleic acid-binding Zn-ribbon protein